MIAVLLVSVSLYGSNVGSIYAQSNSLGQSGNSEAEQTISQSQASAQDSQCASGDITALSCNNVALQAQLNANEDEEKPNPNPNPNPNPDDKVTLCHIPPGNPGNAHTISVSPNAVPAHLAHGDTLGACRV